ncbi:MAG: ExeA family protein [Planctomycetota bacterium]
MYESFFELEGRPFLASPIAERYYPAASAEHARVSALRCIERGSGTSVILGSAGTGKSTLCHVLARQLRDQFHIAMLTSARLCTRRALLQNILFELKQPYRDREEGELRLSLIDFLEPGEACPNGMVVLVDEAHLLPLRLLEELRMLTNLVRDDQPRVRLVLAASLTLDERLASPRLESFNQRIAARCYLQSMNREETCGYVRAQLSAVGGTPDRVITEDGLQAVYRATDGIPRLVNQLCDHVLIMAAIGRRIPVGGDGVEEAWADLQQLPSPWTPHETMSNAAETNSDILEFGELDDPVCGELDPDETPAATEETPAATEKAVEPQVADRLEEIEAGIAAVSDDNTGSTQARNGGEEGGQFQPSRGEQPEIELIFHQAHDPFSEPFDDEEVIVDPFNSVEQPREPRRAAAACDDGTSTIPFHASQPPCENATQPGNPGQPSSARPDQTLESVAESISHAVDSRDSLPGDDRDLLEIHDQCNESDCEREAPLKIAPRRRAYRQLFANLRRA